MRGSLKMIDAECRAARVNHTSLPAGPVAFPPLVVRNCQNSHHVSNDTVEQAVWIAVEDVSAGPSSEERPSIGRKRDLLDGMSQLSEKPVFR
jgi:hypothetical protein